MFSTQHQWISTFRLLALTTEAWRGAESGNPQTFGGKCLRWFTRTPHLLGGSTTEEKFVLKRYDQVVDWDVHLHQVHRGQDQHRPGASVQERPAADEKSQVGRSWSSGGKGPFTCKVYRVVVGEGALKRCTYLASLNDTTTNGINPYCRCLPNDYNY